MPLLTLVLGLLLSTAVAASVRAEARDDAQYQFDQSAHQASVALEHRLQRYLDRLRNIGNFVANAPDADPAQFRRFVTADETFVELPSFAALFFIHRVDQRDLPAFVAERLAVDPAFRISRAPDGTPGATTTPTGTHYLLSMFLKGNLDIELPTGGDAAAVATVRALMAESEQTGKAVATSFRNDPLVVAAADSDNLKMLADLARIEFFVAVPVYASEGPGLRGPLLGWTGAMITDFEDVLRDATSGQLSEIGVDLTVELGTGGDREPLSTAAEDEALAGRRDVAAFVATRPFTVHGVSFQTDIWSTPGAGTPPPIVYLLFGAGALASVLAASALYLRRLGVERERAAGAELADRAQFEVDVSDSVTDALVVLDGDGRVVSGNRAWRRLVHELRGGAAPPGVRDGAAVGACYVDVLCLAGPSVRATAQMTETLGGVLTGDGAGLGTELDLRLSMPRGTRWYSVRVTPLRSRRGGAVVVHSDITEQKLSEDELEHQASRDTLTGLVNRVSLQAAMEASLASARHDHSSVAVLFIDLDGFKAVNDTYGHGAGDELLQVIAERLIGAVRPQDVVARLGGDEFVVFLPSVEGPQLPERTARRIVDRISDPVSLEGAVVRITASAGVSHILPQPLTSAEELLAQADLAMYHAKQQGGGDYDLASSPHKFAARLHD